MLEHFKFTVTNRWVLKMKQLPSELNRQIHNVTTLHDDWHESRQDGGCLTVRLIVTHRILHSFVNLDHYLLSNLVSDAFKTKKLSCFFMYCE